MKGQKVLNPRGMALLVGMLPLYHEDVEAGAQKLCYLWLGKAVKRKQISNVSSLDHSSKYATKREQKNKGFRQKTSVLIAEEKSEENKSLHSWRRHRRHFEVAADGRLRSEG